MKNVKVLLFLAVTVVIVGGVAGVVIAKRSPLTKLCETLRFHI